MNWLAHIYNDKGWYTDAVKFASRAAEDGCANAMNRLGLINYGGKGVDKDKVIGNIWFLRAAKIGSEWGQRNIAFEFLSGETGMPKDINEARYWLTLAAEQGNEECQKKLVELDEQEKEKRKKELEQEKEKRKRELEQEKEKRKKELEQEKEKLIEQKNIILSKILEINKIIDAAQSQQEEDNLMKEKDKLNKELAALDTKINGYE